MQKYQMKSLYNRSSINYDIISCILNSLGMQHEYHVNIRKN